MPQVGAEVDETFRDHMDDQPRTLQNPADGKKLRIHDNAPMPGVQRRIDVLELVLEIERLFGVSIEDEQTGMKVLRSVDTIAAYIRTQGKELA